MNLLARLRPRSPAASVDLADPKVALDPFPHYEELRRLGPVHFLPVHGWWIVLGYDEVKAAFARPDLFSSRAQTALDAVMLGVDPPDHAPVRRLASRLFASEALDRIEARAKALAGELLRPELELVGGFARPISTAAAADVLGLDDEDRAAFLHAAGRDGGGAIPFMETIPLIQGVAHRARPFHRFMAEAEPSLSEEQARSLVTIIWLAAIDTTERLIANSALRLIEDGTMFGRIKAEPALLRPFLAEVTRLNPSEHLVPRIALAPARIGGVEIPAGATVQLCVSAANRDPAQFERPAELWLERPPAKNFCFGHGVHQCIGGPLARRVVAAAIDTLIRRSTDLRPLQPLDRIQFHGSPTSLGPSHMLVGL
jgi:cytochrome P450